MLQPHPSCDGCARQVRTDPHFEAHIASLAWSDYRTALNEWAAARVLELVPGLQFSVEARLKVRVQGFGTGGGIAQVLAWRLCCGSWSLACVTTLRAWHGII